MSSINDYWSLAMASEELGISKASLTAWRLDAVDAEWHEMDEPDHTFGAVRLWHKDKWNELLGLHYAKDIERLVALDLVFTAEAMDRAEACGYALGFKNGHNEGYEKGLTDGAASIKDVDFIDPIVDPPKGFTFKDAEPESLVEYATTKGPDFGKLTDGHGFQSIV